MKLINADAIVHYQSYDDEHEEFLEHESTIADFLDKMTNEGCPKTVDAAPVRHGRWIETKHGFCCNQCHTRRPLDWDGQMWLSSFCPDCGAMMDWKDGDGNG